MKTAFLTLIAIFTFCGQSFAQNNKSLPCPVVSVMGPAGITAPGESATFSGNVYESIEKLNTQYDIQYKWTVSGGTISEGQGTSAIRVLQNNFGGSTTVKLEVIGLPEGCENTASESMFICILYSFVSIDEFSIAPPKIDNIRLNNFAARLNDNRSAQGYIIENLRVRFQRKQSFRKTERLLNI